MGEAGIVAQSCNAYHVPSTILWDQVGFFDGKSESVNWLVTFFLLLLLFHSLNYNVPFLYPTETVLIKSVSRIELSKI